MKVISSQRYVNWDIVNEKKAELVGQGKTKIEIVVWETGLQDLDGNDVYVMGDKHHTRLAAIALGIEIKYVIDGHPEGLTGEDLLEQSWIDSDWRYIDTDIPVWQ